MYFYKLKNYENNHIELYGFEKKDSEHIVLFYNNKTNTIQVKDNHEFTYQCKKRFIKASGGVDELIKFMIKAFEEHTFQVCAVHIIENYCK